MAAFGSAHQFCKSIDYAYKLPTKELIRPEIAVVVIYIQLDKVAFGDPIMDPAKTLKDASEALGNLLKIAREVKGSFAFIKSMPDVALIEMEVGQIDDTVRAVEEAINLYLSLALNPKQFEEHPEELKDLAAVKLKALIENKRGHCKTIRGIREEYLQGWLDKQSKDHKAETKKVDLIFDGLAYADDDLFRNVADVADYTVIAGEEALKAALANDQNEVKRIIRDAATKLLDLRKSLVEAQVEVLNIKNDFIGAMKLSAAETG